VYKSVKIVDQFWNGKWSRRSIDHKVAIV